MRFVFEALDGLYDVNWLELFLHRDSDSDGCLSRHDFTRPIVPNFT
jgi:hypothetical protein